MRRRTILLAFPWVLVLVAAPEFLWNVYSLRLPGAFDDGFPVFGISIATIYSAPVVGIALAAIGFVKRMRSVAIHGAVTFVLGAAVLVYANSVPPKRFYAAGLVNLSPVLIEPVTIRPEMEVLI